MVLVERKMVEELVRSEDLDLALVYRLGGCELLPGAECENLDPCLVIVHRRDLDTLLPGPITGERLDALTCCLDNAVRDLGA